MTIKLVFPKFSRCICTGNVYSLWFSVDLSSLRDLCGSQEGLGSSHWTHPLIFILYNLSLSLCRSRSLLPKADMIQLLQSLVLEFKYIVKFTLFLISKMGIFIVPTPESCALRLSPHFPYAFHLTTEGEEAAPETHPSHLQHSASPSPFALNRLRQILCS